MKGFFFRFFLEHEGFGILTTKNMAQIFTLKMQFLPFYIVFLVKVEKVLAFSPMGSLMRKKCTAFYSHGES